MGAKNRTVGWMDFVDVQAGTLKHKGKCKFIIQPLIQTLDEHDLKSGHAGIAGYDSKPPSSPHDNCCISSGEIESFYLGRAGQGECEAALVINMH